MAGRAFAFADPKIIELAKTKFIPVCLDDWYQRRRQDDEGVFFRSVADQGPRKGANGATRQGIYAFTASGKLLEFKNAGQDVAATREQLDRALKKWNALPESERQPGAVTVPPHGKLDANYARTPPQDGLILKVNGRILDAKSDSFVRGTCELTGGMKASRDFLWLTAEDVKSLLPGGHAVGDTYRVPDRIARRIARFHLLDNTRGEPIFWKPEDVKKLSLSLTLAEGNILILAGEVKLESASGDRGYDAKMTGLLHFDPATKSIDRFDAVSVGDHWGDDSFTQSGARSGKTPFGVAFGLANVKVPGERVPPQAARDWNAYINAP